MNSPAVRRLKDGYTGMFIRATYTETHHVGKEASIWPLGNDKIRTCRAPTWPIARPRREGDNNATAH